MPTIQLQHCLKCGTKSGTKIVCDNCRIELSPYQRGKTDTIFQKMIVEIFNNVCVDCGHSAPTDSGELCADHLDTKGSDPQGRFDLSNAVCRCLPCHNKRGTGEHERIPSENKIPKETQARSLKTARKHCKCRMFCNLLPLDNGYCILSQHLA